MLDKHLQLAERTKAELLKQKQLKELEREIADLRQGLLTASARDTLESSKDKSTSRPTSRDAGSICIETAQEILVESIPYPLPIINIVGEKRPIRKTNDLGLY